MTPEELSERLLDFAVRVGKVVDSLPDTRMGRHVAGQLVRCGTSPAPNYEEACAEESKKDFIIDIGEVRKGVGPDMCLLGNIDAYEVVEKATEAELEAEIARQVRVAGAEGGFIVGVGSPLTLVTPPERADLLVRCARKQAPAHRGD